MTWHVIRVRSKDAQKQLARTSLSFAWIITKTSDVSHAMANHLDHEDAIVSEKLELFENQFF